MHCNACKNHAVWEHTFFVDKTPHRLRLCAECAQKIDANGRTAAIRTAGDHAAKNSAVKSFVDDVAGLSRA